MFSLVFGVAYFLCFYFDLSLVKYYPEGNEVHLTHQPGAAGPPIAWYGWLASSALVSAVLALVMPWRWTDRLWHGLSWMVPAAVLVVILVYERRWFF